MYNPVSTYRIQFNEDFPFDHFDALLSYFQKLGVSTIYASPIFSATPGSTHGYDGVDPAHINPEIGTYQQLMAISQRLKQMGMGWVQDIVPNHMAYHPNNAWLMDVLEKGPLSRFAYFFDTALASSFFQGRIMAPFLPEALDKTVANGELTLAYEQTRLVLKVSGNVLPLKPTSYATVLQAGNARPNEAIKQLLIELDQLHYLDKLEEYALAWDEFRLQLVSLIKTGQIKEYVITCITAINADATQLRQLADKQHYRFCTEPESRQEMNYRRFFAINGLICLNIGDEITFQHVHALTKKLVDEGVFQGLRIDHIDGLFDPTQYLQQLRGLVGETYIVVEKILHDQEDLPDLWPVEGTSGYDFLAMVNNLLTDGTSESAFRTFYQALIGTDISLSDHTRYRKAYFLAQYMGGELTNLYHYFLALNLADDPNIAIERAADLKFVIGELLVECPVYRYYGNQFPMPDEEAKIIRKLLANIRQSNPSVETAVDVLETALLTRPPLADADYNQRALRFYQRLMQFSGPLMAKGVEDTLMYTYNCFIGHNEVGDSPERFGMPVDAFHRAMQHRQQHWPMAQNTTATHDTKRGEDVRARLNVLTNLAGEWLVEVKHWQQLNQDVSGELDANDEYLIYQNLLGAYPMPGQDEDDFPNRFRLYLEKALQEAKRHITDWTIDETYHEQSRILINRLLDRKGPFWTRFQPFQTKIADFGVVNSLVQVILKFTCPGVPDLYQGGEGWDLSLVDPDNRRPVDFATRQQWLEELTTYQQSDKDATTPNRLNELWQHRFDGRIKFWLTHRLLQERQQNTTLFANGQYIPLVVEGAFSKYIIAFARQHEQRWYVVIAPLHTAQLCQQQGKDIRSLDWKNTCILLPDSAPASWTNQLTGESGNGHAIPVQTIFEQLPVALLRL